MGSRHQPGGPARAGAAGQRALAHDDRSPASDNLALAVARSWSNALTASAGIVSVIGGPLPTGRRRAIDQVIRTTAPMHDGFAGGAFLDASGGLLGVATAAEIRGLGVIIPAAIAWKAAAAVLEHGGMKRGYLGIAGQPVTLPEAQRAETDHGDEALLVTAVTAASPAARAGLLVGDVILALDGHPIESPEDLLDLLVGDRVGHDARRCACCAAARRAISWSRWVNGRILSRARYFSSARLTTARASRASLNGSLRVVGEFATLAAAEASGIEADGILVIPTSRLPTPTARRGRDAYVREGGTALRSELPEPLTPARFRFSNCSRKAFPTRRSRRVSGSATRP